LIRAKSEANGCSITVDFTEKRFYSSTLEAGILVLPPYFESHLMALLEALVSGLP
jgi:hypothetical protein